MMKKINFYLFALMAMVGVACSNDDTEFETGDEGVKMTLFASVDDNDEGTRATLEQDGATAHFKWAKGDKISVFTSIYQNIEFTLDDAYDGQSNGMFNGTIPSGQTIGEHAFYPHATQHYGMKMFLSYYFLYPDTYTPEINAPLYGTIENGKISFKYLTGIVKVTLKNVPAGAAEFRFTAPGKNITGLFDVETSGADKVINVTDGDDYSTYTYGFNPLTTSQDMEFYVPLPVGTYENGFKIEVMDNTYTNVLFEKKTTSAKTIKRATVTAMKALDAGLGYELNGTTFTIYNESGLKAVNKIITDDLATYASYNITLENNITLTGENNWTPIGTSTNPYTGVFDGNGKSITGLNINNKTRSNNGLIGYLGGYNGMIKNLTLIGCDMTCGSYSGGIVGYNDKGVIQNCIVKSTEEYDVNIISTSNYIGGIVGYSTTGQILDCQVLAEGGKITIESESCIVGGIAGASMYYNGKLTGCKVIGSKADDITIRSTYPLSAFINSTNNTIKGVGGITGVNKSVELSNCTVKYVSVIAEIHNVGGIIGFKEFGSVNTPIIVENCKITGVKTVGEVIGNETYSGDTSGCKDNIVTIIPVETE